MNNMDLRNMYMDAIDLANKYESIPWEAKRLIFQLVQEMAEKKADESIKLEFENLNITVDDLVLGGIENAESLQSNKLGELSE